MNQKQNTLQPESILIVDDNLTNLKLLAQMISDQGYKVRIASDGKIALKSVQFNPPDLILLDIMMPKMDGYQVCFQLKVNPITKDIPVIFVSALDEVFNKIKAFEIGAADYITKPFQEQEVLARIEHQLQIRRLTKQLMQQNISLAQEVEERKLLEVELTETQHWLEAINDANPNTIYIYDLIEQRLIYCNRQYYNMLGYKPEEMIQLGASIVSTLVHPEDWQIVSQHHQQLKTAQNNEVFDVEYRMRHKNGEWRWLLTRKVVFTRDADGKPTQILGVAQDITQRQQTERLIAGQNQILKAIASDVSLTEILTEIAHLVESQSGQMKASFLLLDDKNRLRLGAAPSLPAGYSQVVDGVEIGPNVGSCGAAVYRKATVIVEDIANDPLWANFRDLALSYGLRACWSTPILATDGTVLGTFAGYYSQPQTATVIDRDLIEQTLYLAKIAIERWRSQQALAESRHWLEAINEANPNIVYVYDLEDQQTVYTNCKIYNILGYTPEEIQQMGKKAIFRLMHPEDITTVRTNQKRFRRDIQSDHIIESEYRILHKNGEWRWLMAREVVFSRDNNGTVRQILTAATDISDRKCREEALRLIVEGTSATTGEEFFRACTRYLAQVLQVRFAFLTIPAKGSTHKANTLAFWTGEEFSQNFEYELVGTPCELAYSSGDITYYPEGVQERFPDDQFLVEFGIQSYLGIPLVDSAGNFLGTLGIMDSSPISNDPNNSLILRIFAARVAAELQRQQVEAEIYFLLSTTATIAQAENFNSALSLLLRSCCEFMVWDIAEAWIPNVDNMRIENFSLGFIHDENGCILCLNDSSLQAFRQQILTVSFAPGEGLPGRVWSSQMPEWIEDVSIESSQLFGCQEIATSAGLKAVFGVPIVADAQVLAIIVFFKKEVIPANPICWN